MLLALRNDKGTVAGGVMYQQALGGAILAELVFDGRVRTEAEGRSSYAIVQDSMPTGDPVLDECLKKMATASRRSKLQTWVQRFAGIRRLKHRVASGLVDKGILRESEGKVLLIFSRRLYPEVDPTWEHRVVEGLKDAVFTDSTDVDPRTSVLVALAHHTGLLKANLDRKRLKARRERIAAIVKGDAVGKATKQAVEAMHAAMTVAVIMPAVIASAHHAH